MSRIKTGIPGLDDLIEGGFIENDVILVTGGPGTGKTTLGLQYLVAGATQYSENGVMVAMEETPARLIRNSWNYGWDLEKLIRENKLRIIYASPLAYKRVVEEHEKNPWIPVLESRSEEDPLEMVERLIKEIQRQVAEINARRVLIDSITSLKLQGNSRKTIHELIRNLENLDATTLLTSETYQPEEFSVEEYLAEGVIQTRFIRISLNKIRAIEILKMRGTRHDEALHPYSFTDQGIVVHATEQIMEENL